MATQRLQPIGRLSYGEGLRIGLPAKPRRGQAVRDTATGVTYVWIDEPGLGDLGFWGALLGAVAGPLASLFGGGGPKPDNAARQQLQQQQGQLQNIQQQVEAQSIFQPKYVFLFGVMALAVAMGFRK